MMTKCIGANRGIGLELARQLTERGDIVYAACRTATKELQGLGVSGGLIEGVDVASDEVYVSIRISFFY